LSQIRIHSSNSPEFHRKPQRLEPVTTRLRNESSDVISVHDTDDSKSQANLSPRARERLAIFDIEVMGKKPHVRETKPGKKVNGCRGETATPRRSSVSRNGYTVRPTMNFGVPSFFLEKRG
jgi:hypothetical protein